MIRELEDATRRERDRSGELAYWSTRKAVEGRLKNGWFERFFTGHFGLTATDYADKCILDIGCGPRGSLEWATAALERVGLDPLADEYIEFGTDEHSMVYIAGGAESVPFPDGYFDVVCSFNSLDHVDDLGTAITEMKRVVTVGGLVLLLTDVHEEPTPQEPICFGWDLVDLLRPELVPQSIACYEKGRRGMYHSVDQGILFDHADPAPRYGVLSARLIRVGPADDDSGGEPADRPAVIASPV